MNSVDEAQIGPYAFGVGRDFFGSYTVVFSAAGGFAAIAALLMLALPAYPRGFVSPNVIDQSGSNPLPIGG